MQPLVSIIMGSTSDLPVMEAACKFFDSQEIPFEMLALSAHRTPDEVAEYAKNAHQRGIRKDREAVRRHRENSKQQTRLRQLQRRKAILTKKLAEVEEEISNIKE